MPALIQTIATPDGPLTILVDDAQQVLASGWSDDHGAIVARVHPSLRPCAIAEGETDAADAAHAYYRGDLRAIEAVRVRQRGTALQVRPKARHAGVRRTARDGDGDAFSTLPRGFYLRRSFTAAAISKRLAFSHTLAHRSR